MSKDFDKSNRIEYSPNAKKVLNSLGNEFDVLEMPEVELCDCGFSDLLEMPRLKVRFESLDFWNNDVREILLDIGRQHDRGMSQVTINLGTDHGQHSPLFMAYPDGTVMVEGKERPPGITPVPHPGSNRGPTPQSTVDNHLQWYEWNERNLFVSRECSNIPRRQGRYPQEEGVSYHLFGERPYRHWPEPFLRYPKGIDNWFLRVGELTPLEAHEEFLSLVDHHSYLSAPHIQSWQSVDESHRILFWGYLCHHCYCVQFEAILEELGLRTKRLPPLNDFDVSPSHVAPDFNRGRSGRTPWQSHTQAKSRPSRGEVRILVWGWQEQMEEKE